MSNAEIERIVSEIEDPSKYTLELSLSDIRYLGRLLAKEHDSVTPEIMEMLQIRSIHRKLFIPFPKRERPDPLSKWG